MTNLPQPIYLVIVGLVSFIGILGLIALVYRVMYEFFHFVGLCHSWKIRTKKRADIYLMKQMKVPTTLNECQEFMVKNSHIFEVYPGLYQKYNDIRANVKQQHNQLMEKTST
jgi:hypothetical protein